MNTRILQALKQYLPTVVMAGYTIFVTLNILIFYIIGDLDWGNFTVFKSLGYMGLLTWYLIFIGVIIVWIPIILLVTLFPKLEHIFQTFNIIQCLGDWVSICLPSTYATISGLVVYTILVAIINYLVVRRLDRV